MDNPFGYSDSLRSFRRASMLCGLMGVVILIAVASQQTALKELDSTFNRFFGCLAMAFLLCAYYIWRLHRWALVAATMITRFTFVVWLVVVVSTMAWPQDARMAFILLGTWVAEAGIFLLLAALSHYIAMSFEVINGLPSEEGRGFEVIPNKDKPT